MEGFFNQYKYGKLIKYLFYSFPLLANYVIYTSKTSDYIYWVTILLYIFFLIFTAYSLYNKFRNNSSVYDKQLFDSMDNLDLFRDYVTLKYKDVKKLQEIYYYVCK